MAQLILAALLLLASSAAVAQNGPAKDPQLASVDGISVAAPPAANQTTTVPVGATVTVTPTEATATAPRSSADNPPPCSRTMTDRCIQVARRHRGPLTSRKRRQGRRAR